MRNACAECDPENLPSLGDVVDVPELLRTLQDSLRQTLATRLGIIWEEQHGRRPELGTKTLDVVIDRALFESIVSELARNTAQALMGLAVEAEPI